MAEKENQRSDRLLKWVGLVIVIALIGLQLYLGATIQEVGIPGIFTVKFGKKEPPMKETPGPPPGKLRISAELKSINDTTKVENFLRDHTGETVYLDLIFVQKAAGGMAEFNGRSDVHKLEFLELCKSSENPVFEIGVDRACDECREGVHEHLLFRINKKGEFFCGFDLDYDRPRVTGSFVVHWVGHIGQGYYAASLTPAS